MPATEIMPAIEKTLMDHETPNRLWSTRLTSPVLGLNRMIQAGSLTSGGRVRLGAGRIRSTERPGVLTLVTHQASGVPRATAMTAPPTVKTSVFHKARQIIGSPS